MFFSLISCYGLKGQTISIDSYTNQLFFNILKDQPDSSILDFLKLYTPSLYEKKHKPFGWTTYTSIDTLRSHQEIHSFIFTRHPYFNAKFTQGKLDIYCKRYDDPKLIQNIVNVQVWFEFETQQEAEIAFSRLVDMFILTATDKKFSSVMSAQKAEFTNSKQTEGFNRIQFRLIADNISRYRYKILFETGNNL